MVKSLVLALRIRDRRISLVLRLRTWSEPFGSGRAVRIMCENFAGDANSGENVTQDQVGTGSDVHPSKGRPEWTTEGVPGNRLHGLHYGGVVQAVVFASNANMSCSDGKVHYPFPR